MSIFANGLVAAMEDETQAAELAIDSTGADSAEADIVEATDISADVEAGTAEIDQASADAETLTRIADTAEAAEADGGLDPVAAEVTEIAVEAIYARLGVKHTSYPALESFSGRSGRVRATRIAVEDIKETVKKIWAAIVVAFQKMYDFVKNFFAKIFDANRKLLARINALEKRLNGKDMKETGGKVKLTGGLSKIGIKHKTDAMAALKDVGSDIAAIRKEATALLDRAKADIPHVTKEITNGKDLESKEDVLKAQKEQEGFVHVFAGLKGPVSELVTAKYSDESGINISFGSGKSDSEEVDALTLADCRTVLGSSEAIVRDNLNAKAELARVEASLASVIESFKKVSEISNEEDDKAKLIAEKSRRVQRVYGNIGTSVITALSNSQKLSLEFAKSGIDYVERSLNSKGAGKKDSDDKK